MRHVVYIPGLGDEGSLERQESALQRWNTDDQNLVFAEPNWHTDEPYGEKLDRLLAEFDEFPNGEEIAIVGASAGGAMAMNIFAERKPLIGHLGLISAKIMGSDTIGPNYQERAPALLQTVQKSESSLDNLTDADLERIITYRPIFDTVIALHDMQIPGATNRRVPAVGHAVGIGVTLLFFANPASHK